MSWIKDPQNIKWVVLVAMAFMGLYVMLGWVSFVVTTGLLPKGAPIKIMDFYFKSPILIAGGKGVFHVEFEKYRHCFPSPRITFIDASEEERQFLFPEWPTVEVGTYRGNIVMDIPELLEAGKYRVQARVYYDCQDADYLAMSPAPTGYVEVLNRKGEK